MLLKLMKVVNGRLSLSLRTHGLRSKTCRTKDSVVPMVLRVANVCDFLLIKKFTHTCFVVNLDPLFNWSGCVCFEAWRRFLILVVIKCSYGNFYALLATHHHTCLYKVRLSVSKIIRSHVKRHCRIFLWGAHSAKLYTRR